MQKWREGKCTCITMKVTSIWVEKKKSIPCFHPSGTFPLRIDYGLQWIMSVIYRIGYMTNITETHGSAFELFQPELFSLVNRKASISGGWGWEWGGQRQEAEVMTNKACKNNTFWSSVVGYKCWRYILIFLGKWHLMLTCFCNHQTVPFNEG